MIRTFTVGEYAEEMSWTIEDNVIMEAKYNRIRCSHAVQEPNGDWRIPRIIRAYNEGGFNQTQVCVDCVLEGCGAWVLAGLP